METVCVTEPDHGRARDAEQLSRLRSARKAETSVNEALYEFCNASWRDERTRMIEGYPDPAARCGCQLHEGSAIMILLRVVPKRDTESRYCGMIPKPRSHASDLGFVDLRYKEAKHAREVALNAAKSWEGSEHRAVAKAERIEAENVKLRAEVKLLKQSLQRSLDVEKVIPLIMIAMATFRRRW